MRNLRNSGAKPFGEKITINTRIMPTTRNAIGGPTLLTPGKKVPRDERKVSTTLGSASVC